MEGAAVLPLPDVAVGLEIRVAFLVGGIYLDGDDDPAVDGVTELVGVVLEELEDSVGIINGDEEQVVEGIPELLGAALAVTDVGGGIDSDGRTAPEGVVT